MSVLGLLTTVNAAVFFEDFQGAPSTLDWHIHGDPSFFQWNEAGHLDVTWDSTQTNTFFIHPLQSVLGRHDDFKIEFELMLDSVGYQSNGNPLTPFEIALGFINSADATHTNFFRGKGAGTVKNLVEFDYFPDTGYGDTIWPAFWSTNTTLNYTDQNDYVLAALPLNKVLAITMNYDPETESLTTNITADGEPLVTAHQQQLSPSFTDFRVDAFAISSYELQGNTSLHAQGRFDNIRITFPQPVTELAITENEGAWSTSFTSRTNWIYQLEESNELNDWLSTETEFEGTGETIEMPVTKTGPEVFTRIRATRW